MVEIEENNVNYPQKNKALNRVVTQKTNAETDKLNPSGNPEIFTNNHNSVINKIIPEDEIQSINNKKEDKKNENMLNSNNNNLKGKRVDRFGNPIIKKGKQKVSFMDKMTSNNFAEIIKIESYKEYNKMEEVSTSSQQNNCCVIE
jgi:hypothetical protein